MIDRASPAPHTWLSRPVNLHSSRWKLDKTTREIQKLRCKQHRLHLTSFVKLVWRFKKWISSLLCVLIRMEEFPLVWVIINILFHTKIISSSQYRRSVIWLINHFPLPVVYLELSMQYNVPINRTLIFPFDVLKYNIATPCRAALLT